MKEERAVGGLGEELCISASRVRLKGSRLFSSTLGSPHARCAREKPPGVRVVLLQERVPSILKRINGWKQIRMPPPFGMNFRHTVEPLVGSPLEKKSFMWLWNGCKCAIRAKGQRAVGRDWMAITNARSRGARSSSFRTHQGLRTEGVGK